MHVGFANPRWWEQVSFKKEVVVRVNDLVFWLTDVTVWLNSENVLLTFKWYVFVWQKCSMLRKYANGHFFNKWNCVSMPIKCVIMFQWTRLILVCPPINTADTHTHSYTHTLFLIRNVFFDSLFLIIWFTAKNGIYARVWTVKWTGPWSSLY